jgi:hypothetical protein
VGVPTRASGAFTDEPDVIGDYYDLQVGLDNIRACACAAAAARQAPEERFLTAESPTDGPGPLRTVHGRGRQDVHRDGRRAGS